MSQSSKPRGEAENAAARETDIARLKFETALAELETIVDVMEEGRLPLDESIAAYRRGGALLSHCQRLLSDAERRIQILDNGELRDYDGALPRAGEP